MLFTGPVCSPTRGTVLTGRNHNRYCVWYANTGGGTADFVRPEKMPLPWTEFTVAEAFKKRGYTTGMFGKWWVTVSQCRSLTDDFLRMRKCHTFSLFKGGVLTSLKKPFHKFKTIQVSIQTFFTWKSDGRSWGIDGELCYFSKSIGVVKRWPITHNLHKWVGQKETYVFLFYACRHLGDFKKLKGGNPKWPVRYTIKTKKLNSEQDEKMHEGWSCRTACRWKKYAQIGRSMHKYLRCPLQSPNTHQKLYTNILPCFVMLLIKVIPLFWLQNLSNIRPSNCTSRWRSKHWVCMHHNMNHPCTE